MAQCGLDNLPDTSPPKWFRWSTPSAHASSPLMPDRRRRSPHADRWATDPVQQPTPTTCPTGPVKIKALDRSRCGRFHARLPRWLHRRGLWELELLRLHSRLHRLVGPKMEVPADAEVQDRAETPTWLARDPQRGGDKIFAVRRRVLTWQLHRSPQVRMSWHQLSFPMSGSWRQMVQDL